MAVDAKRGAGIVGLGVFGAQLGEHADDVGAAVLRQRARDHLQRRAHRTIGALPARTPSRLASA